MKAAWKDGVTTFLPTLITNSDDNLKRNFKVLFNALEKNDMLKESVPGFHLEGPYISPLEGYSGCHPVKHIRKPSWEEFMGYQDAGGGMIIEVTLAPEIDGALSFIRKCHEAGILVALGHTNAGAMEIAEAVREGARLSTHLGNGAANLIHRHKNPIWPQLADDLLTATVIADGHHLLPEELSVFYKVKGPGKLVLISDVTFVRGMAPGRYNLFGSEVDLTEDGLLYNPVLNCLAGASFPLVTGIGNIIKFASCSQGEAINMATGNIAHILGLNDRGVLAPGKRADLILFKRTGASIEICKTWVKGQLVSSCEC